MRVLLSAYACEPSKGSEPGVGWHWAVELAKLGHEVVVLTRKNNRNSIEAALPTVLAAKLTFHYYDLPRWVRWWKRGGSGVHLYYTLWQWGAYRYARRVLRHSPVDVVHHVTFGVLRQASFMGRLGLPFMIGPVGGGEASPELLRRALPFRYRIREGLRDLGNIAGAMDPTVLAMFRSANLILCKTPETLARIPAAHRPRGIVYSEIGTPETESPDVPAAAHDPEFLYAGRLLYWKGVHLALQAVAEVRKTCPAVRLSIVGNGPDAAWLDRVAGELDLGKTVRWVGALPQRELYAAYPNYLAFIFPSLHDSSGNVLLEAMAHGVPVICLRANGPNVLVDESCGFKIRADAQPEGAVVKGLAHAMIQLIENPALRADLSRNAIASLRERSWSRIVSGAYERIDAIISHTSGREET